jgi:hypothetical protein
MVNVMVYCYFGEFDITKVAHYAKMDMEMVLWLIKCL